MDIDLRGLDIDMEVDGHKVEGVGHVYVGLLVD